MRNRLRDPKLTNNPFSQWAGEIIDEITENKVGKSSDFSLKTGPAGSSIKLQQNIKYPETSTHYLGEWDITSGYLPGDIVRVLPNKIYDLPWVGGPAINSFPVAPYKAFQTLGGAVKLNNGLILNNFISPYFVPLAGVYVCVAEVPAFDYLALVSLESELDTNYHLAVNLLTTNTYSSYLGVPFVFSNIPSIRFFDVNYYPIWPELPDLAKINYNSQNRSFSEAKGRYWELISLLPTTSNQCIGKVTTVSFVDAQPFAANTANPNP